MPYKPFSPGDVVWGPDPYHEDDPHLRNEFYRPWVVLSTDAFPLQGDEYLCCALTHNVKADPNRITLAEVDWEKKGSLAPSQLDPTTVMTMKHGWITRYTGRLAHRPVARARKMIAGYMAKP